MSHKILKALVIIILILKTNVFAQVENKGLQPGLQPTLQARQLPENYSKCDFCHLKKNHLDIPSAKQNRKVHAAISLIHGRTSISCNHCHDSNHFNYLRTSQKFPANFNNSSPVCQRCHEDIFSDWNRGIHGKRSGGWNKPQTQFHCIDCHNAHSVKFKPMKAIPKR